jgi:hypothetical protein
LSRSSRRTLTAGSTNASGVVGAIDLSVT